MKNKKNIKDNFIYKRIEVFFALVFLLGFFVGTLSRFPVEPQKEVLSLEITQEKYWVVLHRKSNVEFLYKGIPNDLQNSELVRVFKVKAGIPGERPTPLPELLGRDYWIITDKSESKDDPETSPYFLTLDIPVSELEPYGPTPYLECVGPASQRGEQCNWILPGSFGLHGVNNDLSRLSNFDFGSSGCIRHSDEDITYLYYLLQPKDEEIRYYIKDI